MKLAMLKIDDEIINFHSDELLGFRETAYAACALCVRGLLGEKQERDIYLKYDPRRDFVAAGIYKDGEFSPVMNVRVGMEGSDVLKFFDRAAITFLFVAK